MSVTQQQIAKHLGMSNKSIMRVLNGHKVTEATRQKVLDAARELGYSEYSNSPFRATIAARYGRQIKTGIIAVVLQYDICPLRGAPFYTPILQGIEGYAEELGIETYLWYQRSAESVPRIIRENGVDGVICLAAGTYIRQVVGDSLFPMVSVVGKNLPRSIGIDDREGCRLAVHHLAELGHSRIAYFGLALDTEVGINRLAGYCQGMVERDLPICETLIDTTLNNFHYIPLAAANFLNRQKDFTGLVCYNDTIAMDMITVMEEMGLNVPRDISVVGFDDISGASRFRPVLTSIGYDRPAMGWRAAKMIDDYANALVKDGQDAAEALILREVFPVRLITGKSTRPLEAAEIIRR